jgi:hypothetical protein
MSASTQTAPRQMSFGRFPMALAMLALIVILAVAIAAVALNGTKAAAPATTGAKGAPPPAVIDHGWSSAVDYGTSVTNVPFYDHGWSKVNEPGQSVTNVPFYDHGWSSAKTLGATYGGSRIDAVDHGARDEAAARGNHGVGGPRLRPQ